MCLFRKKKKEPVITGNKFNIGDHVGFRPEFDLVVGYIFKIKQDENGNIFYDVNVGGECPYIKENIPEEKLHLR